MSFSTIKCPPDLYSAAIHLHVANFVCRVGLVHRDVHRDDRDAIFFGQIESFMLVQKQTYTASPLSK